MTKFFFVIDAAYALRSVNTTSLAKAYKPWVYIPILFLAEKLPDINQTGLILLEFLLYKS
jgi:hypothetical protein